LAVSIPLLRRIRAMRRKAGPGRWQDRPV